MSGANVQSIVVLGEPLTGWVAAAMLSAMLRPMNVHITLLTSREFAPADTVCSQPVVSSNCLLNQANLLALLGVSLPEFVQRCQAGFRLGDHYCDATGAIDFMQSFTGSHFSFDAVNLAQILARLNRSGVHSQAGDYSFTAQMARAEKCYGLHSGEFSRGDLANIGVNFLRAEFIALFEARKNRLALEHINLDECQNGGLNNLQLERAADGSLSALQLGERRLAAELFIDCSGRSRYLIGQLGGTKPLAKLWHESLDQQVCNAQFAPERPATQYCLQPQSLIKAVFLPGRAQLECFYTSAKAVPRSAHLIDFYRSEQSWVKNCVALGHAAADIGNFAVNELDLLQQTIPLLVEHFPRLEAMPALARQFNYIVNEQLDYYWDFHWLLLNSGQLQRDCSAENTLGDSIFSTSLQQRLASYRASAQMLLSDYEVLPESYWASFLLGLHYVPERCSPACELLDLAQVNAALAVEKIALQQRLVGLKPYGKVMQSLARADLMQ